MNRIFEEKIECVRLCWKFFFLGVSQHHWILCVTIISDHKNQYWSGNRLRQSSNHEGDVQQWRYQLGRQWNDYSEQRGLVCPHNHVSNGGQTRQNLSEYNLHLHLKLKRILSYMYIKYGMWKNGDTHISSALSVYDNFITFYTHFDYYVLIYEKSQVLIPPCETSYTAEMSIKWVHVPHIRFKHGILKNVSCTL